MNGIALNMLGLGTSPVNGPQQSAPQVPVDHQPAFADIQPGSGYGDSVTISPEAFFNSGAATTQLPPESVAMINQLDSDVDFDHQQLVNEGLFNQSTLEGLRKIAELA